MIAFLAALTVSSLVLFSKVSISLTIDPDALLVRTLFSTICVPFSDITQIQVRIPGDPTSTTQRARGYSLSINHGAKKPIVISGFETNEVLIADKLETLLPDKIVYHQPTGGLTSRSS
jgi:hypothetical protein